MDVEINMDLEAERSLGKICRVAHAAGQEFKRWFGTEKDAAKDLVNWEDLPIETRVGITRAARKIIEGEIESPRQAHEEWLQNVTNDGYVYGEKLDREAKTHPCLVPYEELSEFDRKKDDIFYGIVKLLGL